MEELLLIDKKALEEKAIEVINSKTPSAAPILLRLIREAEEITKINKQENK